MSFCSNTIPENISFKCGDVRPMSLDERRQLMERETWISNVVRILDLPRWEAENLWVRIKIANDNDSWKQRN